MSSSEIVVVGGGIGGLTGALALARAGRAVRVLERASGFTEVGAGLQLAPNATRLLDRLGVLDEVLDIGVQPARLVLADARTGDGLAWSDLERARRVFGHPYVVMHRHDLLDILLRACQAAGVTLETDRAVTGVQTSADEAQVTCADGSSYAAHAVVAADGLRSTLRASMHADEPVTTGDVAYRGALPIEEVKRPHDPDTVIFWLAPGMHLVQYPVRRGEMYNQVAVFSSPSYAAGAQDWGNPEELEAAFAGTCPPVRTALDSLNRGFRWPIYDRPPIDRMTQGRVVLLGDAAHAMVQFLAQGACQAIEDAVTLAEQLARHDPVLALDAGSSEVGAAGGQASLERALAAYESIRAPRVARVQRSARVWGEMWHIDGVGLTLRNELFRRIEPDDFSHADWLWGWRTPGD